jgi:hypothetical protein
VEADFNVTVSNDGVTVALFVKRVRALLEPEDFGEESRDELNVGCGKRDFWDRAA